MNLDPIIEAVRQALALCRDVQMTSLRSVDKFSNDKQDTEPVTLADYGSQAIIGRTLQQHFPDDAVLSEEAGSQFLELTTEAQKAEIINYLTHILDVNVNQTEIVKWLDFGSNVTTERTWIIDPIDGTKGFINLRHYAVGVGIVENGQATGAIMGTPVYDDDPNDSNLGALFYIKDGKAYRQRLDSDTAQEIHVSERTTDARVVQSFEKKHASKSRMAKVREKAGLSDAHVEELDSMVKYAMVASGDADVYMRLPNLDNTRPHMVWDHAPGVALVIAAGGKVTDVDGSPLDFSQGRTLPNRGMLVSNGKFHDRLVAATLELLEEEAAETQS
jgi:3'(2'), 5'-bisphosphate nucleotidase